MTQIVNNIRNPKLSIIIPVYNGSKRLDKCLTNIQQQTFTDFECIIVDDASKDYSEKIINKYCHNDQRFIYFKHNKNQGAAKAKKTGILVAKGQYVLCIDQDDWINLTMLQKLYTKALATNADMIYCHYLEESYGKTIPFYQEPINSNSAITIKDILSWGSYFPALWNKLIRTSILHSIHFPESTYSEDRAIMTQVILTIKSSAEVSEALYHWRDEPTTTSRSKKRILKNIIDDYKSYSTIIMALAIEYRTELRNFEQPILAHLDKISRLYPGNKKIIKSYIHSVSQIFQYLQKNEYSKSYMKKEIRRTIAKFRWQNACNILKHIRWISLSACSYLMPVALRKLLRTERLSD